MKDYLIPLIAKGSKTQTRRIVKLPKKQAHPTCTAKDIEIGSSNLPEVPHKNGCMYTINPYYKKDETIYIKENHFRCTSESGKVHIKHLDDPDKVYNKMDDGTHKVLKKSDLPKMWDKYVNYETWLKKSKLLLPAFAARHFIKIKSVRVERLQDISDGDCMAEGIKYKYPDYTEDGWYFNGGYASPNDNTEVYETPRDAFKALIDSVDGEGTWESNPFVFVYEFEKTEKPET